MPHVLADTRSGKGSCLKAGRDSAVRQFCLKAIDIDLAQQIKESQNSEAKATSCRFWSTPRNESEKPHDGKRVAPSTHVTKPVSEGSRAVASLAPSDKAC